MAKLLISMLICLIVASSCNNSIKESQLATIIGSDSISTIRKRELPGFLSKFRMLPNKVIELNFIMADSNLPALNNPIDTIFTGYGSAYGILSDTNHFYALLWYSSDADIAGLKVTTLDKSGVRLDEQWLTASFPGDDCGDNWYDKELIKSDMTMLLLDSIVTYDCDSGIPPESTWKHQIDSMDAKINANGKIEFSKPRQTRLD